MPFTDLLTHILPGIDDGPESMDESVRMAHVAAREGTYTLVAAPHQRDIQLNTRLDDVRKLLADLNSRLRREATEGAPRVRVLMGMETHMDPALPEMVDDGAAITLNNSRFIMVANPFGTFPDYVDDVLTRLRLKRLVPVLARPERNEVLRRDFGRMRNMVSDGTLFVVSAGSVTGAFGKDSQRAALRMIQQRLAHAVVSDMHRLEGGRPPGLRRAYRWVERASDEGRALRLFDEQPAMILNGHSPVSESGEPDDHGPGWLRAAAGTLTRAPWKRGP